MLIGTALAALLIFQTSSGLVQVDDASAANFLKLLNVEGVKYLFIGDDEPSDTNGNYDSTVLVETQKGLARFLVSKNAKKLKSIAIPSLLISGDVALHLSGLPELETIVIFGPVNAKAIAEARIDRLTDSTSLRLIAIADPSIDRKKFASMIPIPINSLIEIEAFESGKDSWVFDSNGCPTSKLLSEKFGFRVK
jgi:hypothetical protein